MIRNASTCLLLLCAFSVTDDSAGDGGCSCVDSWEPGEEICSGGPGCSCEWVTEKNEGCAVDCHELNAECVAAPDCDEACAEDCAERRTRCLRGCVEEHLECSYHEGTCESDDDD